MAFRTKVCPSFALEKSDGKKTFLLANNFSDDLLRNVSFFHKDLEPEEPRHYGHVRSDAVPHAETLLNNPKLLVRRARCAATCKRALQTSGRLFLLLIHS